MSQYQKFLDTKQKSIVLSGFDINESELNKSMFDFQKFIVKRALKAGKYAIFADCGLGKTLMQLEWANKVNKQTNKSVLILAPLAVAGQTIKEGAKFHIDICRYDGSNSPIQITNYEQLENIDCSIFSGIVLDESSILKNFEGATKKLILDLFAKTPYKLACTATPSPNDPMELGNHSEFLDVMSRNEMLAMYFVHDGGETAKWRLKGHATKLFYQFIGTWAIMLNKPNDIGFEMPGYNLPSLNLIEKQISTPKRDNGSLFNDAIISATNFNAELRLTKKERLDEVVRIVNERVSLGEDVIVWIKQNEEGDILQKLIPKAKEVRGSDSNEYKESVSLWFTNNECICQCQKKKGGNIAGNGMPTIKTGLKDITTSQKIEENHTHPNQKLKQLKKYIQKNGTVSIKNELESTMKKIENEEGNDIETGMQIMKNLENGQNNNQGKIQNGTQKQDLEICSENCTELHLNNTKIYLQSKTIDVQYATEKAHSLPQNNDCMLTIAMPQERLEDCFALTATMPSENSKTISETLKKQSCTCGANQPGKVLISKTKILGMGINMQNCRNQIFASLDFSFEGLYQAIRRSYRFGQKNEVNIYLITTDTMSNVKQSIDNKQKQFEIMQDEMSHAINANLNNQLMQSANYDTKEEKNEWYHIKRGDCVQLISELENESVGLSVFSPPFAELYTYSSHLEDMGNSKDYNEFLTQFSFLIKELHRVMMQGRNVAVHCMDLPVQKGKHGFIGLRDFSGLLLRAFEDAGFVYASRVTIWKDPVVEMQRTKALGLLHKQVKKDSTMSRVGIPDYVMIFRKDGERSNPVTNTDLPVDLWQKYASPVWMDINYGNTLQGFRNGREENDEKHICPLQLGTIERLVHLYSNKGDTVFTPFMGIGSEVFQAVKMERKGIGFELKESYYDLAKSNLKACIESKRQLVMM